jgi:hypothetical protein
MHVLIRAAGASSTLSGFLTGEQVTDPVYPSQQTTFNDLQRRQQYMAQVLGNNCKAGGLLEGLASQPVNFVH